MKKTSLVVPCFNEETNIEPFYDAVQKTFGPLKIKNEKIDFEIVFVDDGSADGTLEKIRALNKKDCRVKCVSFARNFGKEAALFAGLRHASGDCSVILDADLQHPVSAIPEMLEKWSKGFEVVEGVKTSRGKEGVFHKTFAKIFYTMISRAVGMDMKNSSDYKLLDKKVVAELSKLKERNTFFRALSFWVGFKKTTVFYEVLERNSGVSKWSAKSLVKYAVNNVVCFSYAPLRIVIFVGAVFAAIGIVLGISTLASFLKGKSASGFPTLLFVMFLGFGGVLLSLGIIGIYIAQIYDEVKGRPQYVVAEKIGEGGV